MAGRLERLGFRSEVTLGGKDGPHRIGNSESIGGEKQLQAPALFLCFEVLIPQVKPKPRRISDIVPPIPRDRPIKVDECPWNPIPEHAVAGAQVPVTYHLRISLRRETGGGIMKCSDQRSGLGELPVGK